MNIRPAALVLLVATSLATTLLPARKEPPASPHGLLRVGLVFDVGGRGDKSFNDAAYTGLLEAVKQLGVRFELAEPSGAEDREAAMRLFAARDFDLVIGVGNIFSRDINDVATEFPRVRFACVDYTPNQGAQPQASNMVGIAFREEEGAFLVGAAAGLESRSHHVGFVGGMNSELIQRFERGFRTGVDTVCPFCILHVAYAGTTADAFRDPAKGKAIAASQIASGADVLFQAAGATGRGVFEAAHDAHVSVIGVDRDQGDEMPGVVITSLIKRVDIAVFDVIRNVAQGVSIGGVQKLGLKEGGIDWVHSGPHASQLAASTVARVEALRTEIVKGVIPISSKP